MEQEPHEGETSGEALQLERRQQSNEALNGNSTIEEPQTEDPVPQSEAEKRDSPTRNNDKKSGYQQWFKQFSEWDNSGGAEEEFSIRERQRSTDSNSSPAHVSRFDLASQSSKQEHREQVYQSDHGFPAFPLTAGEF